MRDEGPSSFILFLFLRLRWGPKNLHLVESNRKLVEMKKFSQFSSRSLGFLGDQVSH